MSNAREALLKKYKAAINLEPERDYISLGPLSVNLAIGNPKGAKSGRVIQIVGRESSGKSTLALDIVAQYQKQFPDRYAMWVDLERSYEKDYARACGVDTERLYRVTAEDAEYCFETMFDFIRNDEVQLVVVDSVPAIIPAAENEKKLTENAKMAGAASVLTRMIGRAVPLLDDHNATMIGINQYRKNFSTLSPKEEIPWGAMAFQYAASVTLSLTRIKTEIEEQKVRATVSKNKIGAPQIQAEFNIVFGEGIDHAKNIITLAKDKGIVRASGAWYYYGTDYKAQGEDNAAARFPLDEIREQIISLWQVEESENVG